MKDGSKPCTHVGDLEETLGSQIKISLALAIVVIWCVSKQMEDLFLSLSSLCKSAFAIIKSKFSQLKILFD